MDISTVDPKILLTDYSMVFQDVVIFDDTVMGNIRLGKHGATDEEVLAAAKDANYDEFVRKLPKGYRTAPSSPVKNSSASPLPGHFLRTHPLY